MCFFGGGKVLQVFFGGGKVSCIFFTTESWTDDTDVFFDGETCANVFFRTFKLFDTMHAIYLAGYLACKTSFFHDR